MAVLVDPSGKQPAVCVGLGCNADPLIAAQKALFEVSQVRPGAVARATAPDFVETLHDYRDVRTLDDHGAFFSAPERLSELGFLLQRGCTRDLDSLPPLGGEPGEDLDRLVAALRCAGCRVLYADLTTPDLEPFPVRVVRTLPIHFGYGEERLAGTGLLEVRQVIFYPEFVEHANLLLVIAAVFERTLIKYGPRGYRYVLLEAGHAAQNVCLGAVESGLAAVCLGGFDDGAMNRAVGLDGRQEAAVYCLAVGLAATD